MRDIRSAEMVLPCADLDPTLRFFTEELGFVLRSIAPADRPCRAVVEAYGLRLCLQAGSTGDPGRIRLHRSVDDLTPAGSHLVAPNGTRVEIVATDGLQELPPLRSELVITQPDDADAWQTGRAGMRYRDLIPGRQGGRFIASHILIPTGGPVPDYPHHHRVRFQMIYCHRGWVRVVYEDQGPAFVMRAGDAVLQPPGILHRVLECSTGLEVVEIGCPAEHETFAEMDRALPTPELRADRCWEGQRFVRHQACAASSTPWRHPGFACRDIGLVAATAGLAGARVVRVEHADRTPTTSHGGELLFVFVTAGRALLQLPGRDPEPMRDGSAAAVPAGDAFALTDCSKDFEFLEVASPALAG